MMRVLAGAFEDFGPVRTWPKDRKIGEGAAQVRHTHGERR